MSDRPLDSVCRCGATCQAARPGEHRDDPALLAEVVQVDVQGPGKQQKAEHAVQQGFIEINAVEQAISISPSLVEVCGSSRFVSRK